MKIKEIKKRKIVFAGVVGLALVLGMVTSALAITNGQPDEDNHPMSA